MGKGFVLEQDRALNDRLNIFPDTHLLRLDGDPPDVAGAGAGAVSSASGVDRAGPTVIDLANGDSDSDSDSDGDSDSNDSGEYEEEQHQDDDYMLQIAMAESLAASSIQGH